MHPTGVEPGNNGFANRESTSINTLQIGTCGSETIEVAALGAATVQFIDPDLVRLIQVWPSLPDPIRSAMMALVNSVSPAPTPTPVTPPKRDTLDDRLPWEKSSNRQ